MAAVIADVVINMAARIIKNRRILPVAVMALSFTAAFFFDINIIVILLVSVARGLYGLPHQACPGYGYGHRRGRGCRR